MKTKIGVVIGVIVFSLSIGCDGRYSMEKTEGGFYRIDKWTGETTWVIGGEAHKVVMPKEKEDLERKLSGVKNFDEHNIPLDNTNKIRVSLSVLWRDDHLHYKMRCQPYNDKLEKLRDKQYAHISFLLVDGNKFDVIEHPVNFNEMRRIVNDNNVAEYLEANGNFAMDKKTYEKVEDVRFGWAGLD